jgi:imidazole glycerol-phosphate synthase subunit HisH
MTRWAAIIDYGMGNLYSVLNACKHCGIEAEITSDTQRVRDAHAVILPGVGAFGDAMREIDRRGLLNPVAQAAASGKPFVGICLGMQLMMEESHEFGRHQGLGLVAGAVLRLEAPNDDDGRPLKVPEVGWNAISRPPDAEHGWRDTLLEGVAEGAFMYFVHSYYCDPRDRDIVASRSRYGQIEYCSTLCKDNLFGCQYHPERSGQAGLAIYRNLAKEMAR